MNAQIKSLYDSTTASFIGEGRHAWHFARGKLRHDPVFFSLLKLGVLPDQGQLLDLGCGQGILMALILAARKQFALGQWPEGWPPPPLQLAMRGIELRDDCVRAAQGALNSEATVERGDIQSIAFARCSAVVLLDVLHYLSDSAQLQLLERIAASLEPGGVLLLRETDASAGVSFQITQWAERAAGIGRGLLWHKMHYRSTVQWIQLLERYGFTVSTQPMSEGTPFSNTLLIARRSVR